MRGTLTETQMKALLESVKLINSTLDLDELLFLIMDEITRNLNAERGTLYIVDESKNEIWSKIALGDKELVIRQPVGKGISGHVAETGKVLNIRDAYNEPRFNPEFDKKSGYRTRSILCMPVNDRTGKTIAVLQILNKRNGFFDKKDEFFTAVFTDYISLAIQNAQLYREALERKSLEDEIAVAGEIQKLLLPAKLPQLDEYELFAYHRPSRYIGGDYYDLFFNQDALNLILADVSGKGTPAALLMASLQATVHNIIGNSHTSLDIVNTINSHLYSITAPDKYATLVWGRIDLSRHSFTYITAGHVPPFLFKRIQQDISVTELPIAGIPVGLLPKFDFREGSVQLNEDDILVICSDGITEAQNGNEEMFDNHRLVKIVSNNFHQDAETIGRKIIEEVSSFQKNGSYEDDITLLIIKRKSS